MSVGTLAHILQGPILLMSSEFHSVNFHIVALALGPQQQQQLGAGQQLEPGQRIEPPSVDTQTVTQQQPEAGQQLEPGQQEWHICVSHAFYMARCNTTKEGQPITLSQNDFEGFSPAVPLFSQRLHALLVCHFANRRHFHSTRLSILITLGLPIVRHRP